MIYTNRFQKIWEFYYKLLSRISQKPIIYVLGDSHSYNFRAIPYTLIKHLGASTAHNLGNLTSKTQSYKKSKKILKNKRKKDMILFSLGEIDCRQHLSPLKKNILEKSIKKTLDNYFAALKKLKINNKSIILKGIPPAGKNYYKGDYRFISSEKKRANTNKIFNVLLEKRCLKENYYFLDSYKNFCDKKGLMKKKYAKDKIHLNKKAKKILKRRLKKITLSP